MKRILTFFLLLISYPMVAQYSNLVIQDFDTLQTPTWLYALSSGILEFVNGNSPSTALPASSPHGINGSWAWKQEGQSGGAVLIFDNINISGYDTAYITFKLAAFAATGSNGVDELDHVTTSVSINNGVNWYDQIKVNGASSGNSSWPYSATGVASRVFSTSSVTVFQPAASGPAPAGYSTVLIKVPNTTNQVRVKITSRSSVGTERYCVDDVALQVSNSKCDASLTRIVSPSTTGCSGSQPVVATLKNYGPGYLNNVTVKWSHNQVPQTDYNWTGNLSPGDSANITLGTFNFTPGPSHNLKAFTHMPNNQLDTMLLNDTVYKNNININPSPSITPASATINGCQGDTIVISGTLTGSPPFTVVVTDGSGSWTYTVPTGYMFSQTFTPTSTITYTFVQIGDGTGCTANSSATVQVTISPAPPAVITPSAGTAFCMGDSAVLLASIGLNFSYLWYKNGVPIPGALGYSYAAKTAGAYTVKVTNPVGCSATSAPVTIFAHPLPVVFLGNDTNIAPVVSLSLNAGPGFSSYLWSTGAVSQAIQIDSAGTGLGTKTVWVKVTNNYGCPGYDTIRVTFVNNPGIADVDAGFTFRIVPNPTSGAFEIELPSSEINLLGLMLTNTAGIKVFSETEIKPYGTFRRVLLPQHLPDGLYLLTITTSAGSFSRKLVLAR